MKSYFYALSLCLCISILFCCSNSNNTLESNEVEDLIIEENEEEEINNQAITYNILSLGDSYTIGQSVCETCKFPVQLKDILQNYFNEDDTFNLQVIAQTGWTTNNLKNAINSTNPDSNKDLVTLLIGVNNQFRRIDFSIYEQEFAELVQTAITLTKNRKSRVIVISIPDYAFTPFGQNSNNTEKISLELDQYNTFAKNYCTTNNISFINITDITRLGLENTDLVALDGLHPSELAYSKFVERILPVAIEKLK